LEESMMHIAECTDSFLPVMDGVGRVVYQYARLLSLSGNECYVITPLQNTGYRGKHPFEIVDFTSVKMPSAPQYQTGIAPLDLHYMERISMIELDLIHVHAPGFAGVEAIRLAGKLNIPLVGTFHSKYYEDFLRVTHSDVLASLGSRFVAEFYGRCDEVWTVSQDAAETLRSYGFKGEVEIVQNGTEMRTPSPDFEITARERFNLGSEPVLLYVGQIDYKKNLRRIIESALLLKTRGHSFQLVFAGQGQDKEDLEKIVVVQGLEKVIFTGHISDRDLLDGLYMAASLFVFPSLYDTAGLVVREAAVMGTPSVVVKNTAPAEVISDGLNGLVCSDDTVSLCDVMERYLFGMSENDRANIRMNAQKSVPLPWETVLTEVEEHYRALIRNGKQKRKSLLTQLIP
jgi:glycosyltransferase involved in cell wall biosynthesis